MQSTKSTGKCVAVFFAAVWLGLSLGPVVPSDAAVLTDQGINDAVEDELDRDPAVSLNWIDVSVNEGIVNLSGSADNILAKERAERIAETVKGVRAVINTMSSGRC